MLPAVTARSIPVTNTSVNPAARSTGVAFFAGGWALRQLWLFWVAPLAGGAIGGLAYRALAEPRPRVHEADRELPAGGLLARPRTRGAG